VDVLALVVEPCDLWSPIDAQVAAEALLSPDLDDQEWEETYEAKLAAQVALLSTKRHRSRLARLVGYVEAQLPWPAFPVASRIVADACGCFRRDRALRAHLSAFLLVDVL
jgi:transposase